VPRPRRLEESLYELSHWPTVSAALLPDSRREAYRRREAAIRAFLGGESIDHVEATFGVGRRQLYRLLKRCVAKHPDGRVHGFRALLPFVRVRAYSRRTPVPTRTRHSKAGAAGAMSALLSRHPALEDVVDRAIHQNDILLDERGRLDGLARVHRRFLERCAELGIAPNEYPRNQDQGGVRSLAAFIRTRLASFARAATAAGAEHVPPPWLDTKGVGRAALRPFEEVQFDGHRVDLRLRVRLVDPYGLTYDVECDRPWLLVILDVATRTVLGWHLALAEEYSRYDVIKCVQAALMPRRKRRGFSIPGLAYAAGAGFVGEFVPGADFACWDRFKLDNAKANLARDTLATLCEFVGCVAELGPLAAPDERAEIERFFGTLTAALSQRLPGTTGERRDDAKRKRRGDGEPLAHWVSASALEELLEVAIANYNGTPHGSLGGRSPLEALAFFLERDRPLVRSLGAPYRDHLYLLQPAYRCTVRGNARKGVRPHVNFYNARYSNLALSQATRLIGQSLRVYFDPEDLRVLHAYLPNGAELGVLEAARPWNRVAHSLRLRQTILRLRNQKRIAFSSSDDPVKVYLDYARKQAKRERRQVSLRAAEAARAERGAHIDAIAARTRPDAPATQPKDASRKKAQPLPLEIGYQGLNR
jgi:transposase InsO family protein